MATINGLYIFVEQEDRAYGVNVTEHTVEEGIAVSDHVQRKAVTLDITGEIVGSNADSVLSQLQQLHQGGTLCKYAGRVSLSNCLITDFSTTQKSKIWGGYAFAMTLKEIRTAATSYKEVKTTTSTQNTTNKSTVEYVYHTVKKGDCIWNLVAAASAPYKSLSRPKIDGKSYSACDWVMKMNPSAFSLSGDFRTLQVGVKIIVGVRNGAAVTTTTAAKKTTTKKAVKQYKVYMYIVGRDDEPTNWYIRSVALSYVSGGKVKTASANKKGATVVSADAGTELRVAAQANADYDVRISFRGDGLRWEYSTSGAVRITKLSSLTRETSCWVRFVKKGGTVS